MLRAKFIPVIALFVGILIGGLLVGTVLRPTIPTTWFDVLTNSKTTLTDHVIMSDIPLAKVVSLSGRARFIDHEPNSSSGIGIGYLLDIELSNIKPEEIPAKYAKDKPIPGGKWSQAALRVPYYTIRFNIELRDKDNFIVGTIEGPEHSVESGRVNKLQGQTEHRFSRDKAGLVRSVTVWTHFLRTPGTRTD